MRTKTIIDELKEAAAATQYLDVSADNVCALFLFKCSIEESLRVHSVEFEHEPVEVEERLREAFAASQPLALTDAEVIQMNALIADLLGMVTEHGISLNGDEPDDCDCDTTPDENKGEGTDAF